MTYVPDPKRYDHATFRRCGRSGLVLPPISLGMWQNFGGADVFETGRAMIRRAFDRGVTHFDLANNYGPPYGSAEENFGQILRKDFRGLRNELIVSTKAGWDMWPGPYGIGASRKYLLASLDDSLKRMGLDYVDIFYAHRPWANAPLEETMGALVTAVFNGKALYVGISSYSPERTREAAKILKSMGVPLLIHQPSYSMLNRWVEHGLLDTLDELGAGCIAFSPLGPGPADQQISEGRAGEYARHRGELFVAPAIPERREHQPGAISERNRKKARADPGADGHRLGPARPARDLSADRRAQCGATGRFARRSREARFQPRGVERDRRLRAGCGHRSLEKRARKDGLARTEENGAVLKRHDFRGCGKTLCVGLF